MIITIDGPAGSGKSTVARRLSKRLGFRYLDTGALYRVVTYQALRNGIRPDDDKALNKLIKSLRIKFVEKKSRQYVLLNGRDVTRIIRAPSLTREVYHYAELPLVRKFMLRIQRGLGARGKIVAEGRDLGSVVFPKADMKFYLDAARAERARRRWKELCQKGISITYRKVLGEIKTRDRRDKNRRLAPLRKVPDAIRLDTTKLSIEEVVKTLLKIIHN